MYLGFSKRLIISLIVIEAIVAAIVLWQGARLLEQSLMQQYEEAIEIEGWVLVSSLTDGLVKFDQLTLQRQLTHWQQRDDLAYATLFNHKMEVMASIGSMDGGYISEKEIKEVSGAIADGYLQRSFEVAQEGERIGTLRLGYRTAHLQQTIRQAQLHNMLVPLLIFFIIAATTLILGRRMTANLRVIEEGVQAFQQGQFDHHIVTNQDGLFSKVAEVLNRFARELRTKIGELNVGNERLQESVETLQQEIAAKSQTEAELQALQQRLLLQHEQSPIGIIDWSTDFRVEDWNPAAEKIFGFSKDEALGQRAVDLIVPPEIKEDIFNNIWQKLLFQHGGEQSTNENITKDGRSIVCEWYNTPVINEDGKVIGIFSLIVDITEKRSQQQMLQRSQKMDSLGKLTGGIAHDYNNMLGVVLGYASMLKKKLVDEPKLLNYAEQILHAAERGAALSKKLLSFSRSMSSEPHQIDIDSVIKDEQLMLEKTFTARIQLILELAKDPWPIWVDHSDLVDAILNIGINAMPQGGQLTISTRNVTVEKSYTDSLIIEPGDYLLLSLADTGMGIDDETRTKIFEPFFTTKGEMGSGLGLSQVYGFMQRCGGAIKLSSEVGVGTCFDLYFPRYRPDEVVNESEAASAQLLGKTLASDGQGETILVVDDEEGLRMVTEEFLSSIGYQVITANGGKEALELLQRRHVDLLLSDVVMPEMDGYQLAATAKELYPDIKIQLASGYNDERHQNYATDELSREMLRKPFELEELRTRVREVLDGSGSSIELSSKSTYMEWSEQAVTGVGELDDDHQVIFELINRCHKLAVRQGSISDMGAILEELLDYTDYHFRREELIMAACGYPHLENHKGVHKILLEKASQLITEFNRGELMPERLLEFLRDWLFEHIIMMDKSIAPYCEGSEKKIKEALER